MDEQSRCEFLSSPKTLKDEQEPHTPSIASLLTSRKHHAAKPKGQFLKEDFERVVSWLEHQSKFGLRHETSVRTPIRKSVKPLGSGHVTSTALVPWQGKGSLNVAASATQERQKHKDQLGLLLSLGTDLGMTGEDQKYGICSVAGKSASLSACYQGMDNFEQGSNIVPLEEGERATGATIRVISDVQNAEDCDINALDNTVPNVHSNDDNEDAGKDDKKGAGYADEDLGLGPTDPCNPDDIPIDIPDSTVTNNATQALLDESDKDLARGIANPSSTQQVSSFRAPKRRASGTESVTSSKRSKTLDKRKAPPRLIYGPSQSTREGFASAYLDSSTSSLEEEMKIMDRVKDSETKRIEIDQKRVELEEQRIVMEEKQTEKKLQAEKELLTMKLMWKKEKLEVEKDVQIMAQKAMLLQSAISNGYKLEDIQAIMAMAVAKNA
ncbi:hypothetical protein EDD11_009317 [Mortierella claussenii]|nr:hypothetical protein EDD11_009317 [Mortierella claussenii]